MQVRVLFFGIIKELAGRDSDSLELPDAATLADVLSHCQKHLPRFKEFVSSLAMSVNQEYASSETKLNPGDEVALLPPVSGGAGETPVPCSSQPAGPCGLAQGRRWRYASIVREAIVTEEIIAAVKRPEDGAVAVFEGIVRDHSRGRRTLYLEYEAYEEMAVKQMEALAAQALSQFAVRDVAIVHRLGRLEIGQTSVLIAIASEHRAAAFDACRWLIDTLKRTVPIWKKEYFEDGVVWADGEPFPADIARGPGSPALGPASK